MSTEALPVLAGVLPVDLEVQKRAAMYFASRENITSDFLNSRDRSKISRLFDSREVVEEDLLNEWQKRWDTSVKGRHLYKFFPNVRERLTRRWLEIDHCSSQFLTGHGNFKHKLHEFKLVPSPFCECSTDDVSHEQSAHHILWECDLWKHERDIMLNSIQHTSVSAIYYTDLVATRKNFRAFKRFCEKYYWQVVANCS